MKVETLRFDWVGGWSSAFPPLDSEQTLVLVFAAPEFIDRIDALDALRAAYPTSHILGCSTSGEISGALVHDRSLSVAVVKFEHTRLALCSARVASGAHSYAAGQDLAQRLTREDLRGAFVLADGLAVNGGELVAGLNAVLPPEVVLTGGLAGDGDRFQRTWVLDQGRPSTGVVMAVGFYGEHVKFAHGSRGGWENFGPERRVTRAQGNVLYELDGKPALALYKDYLGERAGELPGSALFFPLSIRRRDEDTKELIRTILAVDEAEQALVFAGDIPKGCLARLMRSNSERLLAGAMLAAQEARTFGSAGPVLALAVSCVGRRVVLGERTEEEIETTLENLPPGTSQVGFYSYGEISPHTGGRCDLHNQTMTLTTVYET